MTLFHALIPTAQRVVVAVALTAVALTAYGLHRVTVAHATRQLREAYCAARLSEIKARNLVLHRFVQPTDTCLALAVLTGETE